MTRNPSRFILTSGRARTTTQPRVIPIRKIAVILIILEMLIGNQNLAQFIVAFDVIIAVTRDVINTSQSTILTNAILTDAFQISEMFVFDIYPGIYLPLDKSMSLTHLRQCARIWCALEPNRVSLSYIHETLYKYQSAWEDVQSARMVTLPFILFELFPWELVHHKNHVRSRTWKPLKLYSRNFIPISISMRGCAECKNGNSAFILFELFPLGNCPPQKSSPLYNLKTA